ncbi:MAG: phosphoribosylanthranilate isomerase [Thermoguttaceae bacterium]
MFRIKICGITNVSDAQSAVQAGADAVGLNFYPASPRFITPSAVRQIRDVLPREIVKVGVFVNAEAKEICQTFDEIDLDLIQLHGDETPEYITQLGNRPVMRAFRLGPEGLQPIFTYLETCKRLGCVPKLVMIDAFSKGVYGGSGETANWTVCAQYPCHEDVPPLVLAGGLTQWNVAQAIDQVRPAAVDTASGVESSPGRKDPAAVIAFAKAARKAFVNNNL